MKINRNNPLRICAGLSIRIMRSFFNRNRLCKLRRKGLQCIGNTYINKGCNITCPANVKIGVHCCIDDAAEFYALDRITIGDRTIVGKGVYLCTGSHDTNAGDFRLMTKPIVIGSYVWIATGATILPGVTIGDGAVIGAMAVVAKDVPAWAVAVGNPARVVRTGRTSPVDFDPLYLATIDWRSSIRRLIDSIYSGQRNERA
jgi:putative colanic acid biosynthesis acetyltransferase WcaF